jgi:hypothetical protein
VSPSVAPAAPAGCGADELLRITIAALNARPMFRLGHVGDRPAIRDSYELASAIEQYLDRGGSGEAP